MRSVAALTPVVLAAMAATASAQVASRKADVDGDGTPDDVAVDVAGGLTVTSGKSRKAIAFKPAVKGKRVEVQVTPSRVKPTLIAVIGDREAVAFEWAAGGLREVWRGSIGPEPPDGESTLHIEAGEYGLVRFHGRAGVARCDGKTAYLDAERFDFKRRKFLPAVAPPGVPDSAPVLRATRTPPSPAAAKADAGDFKVTSASSQYGRKAGELIPPLEIEDGDVRTAWTEGRTGFGRGEFVTARSSLSAGKVAAVRLVPGHGASEKAFRGGNRLKTIGLLVGAKAAFRVELPDAAQDRSGGLLDPYWIALPQPVAADCVSLVVIDVYRQGPQAGGHTAIAELAVLTEMALLPGGGLDVLAGRVAVGGRDGEEAARALERIGPRAEAALVAEAQGADGKAQLRLRRVLASLPAGAEELARGIAGAELGEGDAALFERGLVALGAASVAPLAAVIAENGGDAEGRARAALALGKVADPAAGAALVAAAGSGPRAVRRAVALALGTRAAGDLAALVTAAQEASQKDAQGREADLWRAVGVMGHAAPAGQARADAAAGIALRMMASGLGYELRYRLIEAAAALGDDALVALVARESGSGSGSGSGSVSGPERIALRRVAVGALAKLDRPEASRALAAAMADPDPGVREGAAAGLAARADAASDAPLATLLLGDRWARVRKAAATGLGGRCRPAPGDALRRAALSDAHPDVRTAALDGIAPCKGVGRFFIDLAADARHPPAARRHAVRLAGATKNRGLTRPLVDLLARERERAFSDADSLGVAAALLYALGRLGDPAAVDAVLRAAEESGAFPELQGAAAAGLGELCAVMTPAQRQRAVTALTALAASGQHQSATPARAALLRCRR